MKNGAYKPHFSYIYTPLFQRRYMRLDHIAYRVADRHKSANFFIDAFGYKIQEEFEIEFDNGSKAKCIALEPPEKISKDMPWNCVIENEFFSNGVYHLAPEIFVSDGEPDSIVGKWVARRDGIGGIHHMAYQVDSVENTILAWQEKGWADFTSNQPFKCEGLTQVFSKPHPLTGVIYEFIEREDVGFCKGNVKALMESTAKIG